MLFYLTLTLASAGVWNCQMELEESVPLEIIRAEFPEDFNFDADQGVPKEYVRSSKKYNQSYFDGSYKGLHWSMTQWGNKALVSYLKKVKHAPQQFQVTDKCFTPGDKCLLKIRVGEEEGPIGEVTFNLKDQEVFTKDANIHTYLDARKDGQGMRLGWTPLMGTGPKLPDGVAIERPVSTTVYLDGDQKRFSVRSQLENTMEDEEIEVDYFVRVTCFKK